MPEYKYNIFIIGNSFTGKTNLINRYAHNLYDPNSVLTVGFDFTLKVINWDPNTLIRLQLWDIPSQDSFEDLRRVFYKTTKPVGSFIVFDVTRASSFEEVIRWKDDLDSKVSFPDGSGIPCVLLANKCDLAKKNWAYNNEQINEFCKDKGFVGWFETSAKDDINVEQAAKFLVSKILEKEKALKQEEEKQKFGCILN